MGEEVTVAYESPARERAAHRKHKLKWHRNDSGGLKAKSGKGGEFCIVRQRPDRRHGIYRWGVTHNAHSIGSTDQLAQAKGLAVHHETKQTAPKTRRLQPSDAAVMTITARKSCKNLRMMGRRDAEAFVDRHYQDVERYELAGVQPNVAAAILDAADTGFDDIRGGEAAEEAPTRSEWEVVVTNPPRAHRGAILNMVPPGDAHAEGNRIFLTGFYDDAEAQHVAGAIAKRYRSQVTFGPKSTFGVNEEAGNIGNIAEERRRPGAHRQIETRHDVDRRDKPVHGHHGHREGEPCEHGCPTGECKPFTKLERDPKLFRACMARAEEIGEMNSSRKMYDLVHADIERRDREVFVVICLDFRGAVRDYVELAIGQRHKVGADVVDIIQPVILSGCDGFIVAHCHPSGKAEPSPADRRLTKSIEKSASVACPEVCFVDHIVVGLDQYYSFADKKLHEIKH